MKHFLILISAFLCTCMPLSGKVSTTQIDAEEAAGNFTRATYLIDVYIAENDLSPVEIYELNARKDIMHRIRLDFKKDKASVIEYIKKYYPDVNDEMLEKWENSKALESKVIDGEKWYFNRAAPNLFRLDKKAIARKAEVDKSSGNKESVLQTHLSEVVNTLSKNGKTQASPVKMRVKYELTLKPNVIPEGEVVRCWLPYPREDNRRQSNISLLSANDSNYVIAPAHYPHRTVYMEKITRKDEPLKFAIEFSYQHAPEWFNLQGKTIQPFDTQSNLFKTYTAERPPHIVFTDSIKAVSERIIGNETDPYQKVKKIWEWIDITFPWAGAREYSTLATIPQYVLENGHGDCGQVTLLFMTLARYNGIPARWQSGFYMCPGAVNMHDWSEFYIEGLGWIPMDESFGINTFAAGDDVKYFYSNGIDAYRWIVNSDFSQPLFPNKIFLRSDNVDFQRGELEWRSGNIYYDQWDWDIDVQTDSTFRFALLTDLHVTHAGNAEEDLQRAVDQINASDDIEFVLVAGDVTEEGDRKSLQKAKNILDRLKVNYYAIPGNHETKWSESGVTAFGDIFNDERFRLEHKGFLFLGFNTGPLMRMADGHVAPQDISRLKEELKKAGKTQPVILVTHYPLQPGDVDNWYDLTDAVRPYNIRTFLGGHYHSNRFLSYDGIPGILNRSTLRDKNLVGGYSVYEVTPDSILVFEQNIGESRRQWAALSLKTKYYDEQGVPDKYPDFSVNKEYPLIKEAWLIRTGVSIYSSPAVYDGKVYVGDDQGTLACYTLAKGKKQWTFQSDKRIVGTPAVADGVVVFGSADINMYGLDARTGRRLWTIAASEPVLGAVAIDSGVAYIGASDHTFRAVDIRTGKLRWTYTDVKGYIETRPLIEGDKVIFGAWDNTLYALDKNTGKELWKWTGGLTRMHFSPAAVWPVAANGKVFITDPQRAMTAIDLETGETVWRTFQSTVRETIGLSEDKKRLYSKTMNDSIVCYSTQGDQPMELWASNVGFGYEHAPSMPVEKDGVVFGSTKGGLIFALDAQTGKVLWKHKVGNSLINTVVPLSKTQVLFTATGGEAGLLKWK